MAREGKSFSVRLAARRFFRAVLERGTKETAKEVSGLSRDCVPAIRRAPEPEEWRRMVWEAYDDANFWQSGLG